VLNSCRSVMSYICDVRGPSASSDHRETKHSLLDSSQYDESNGGSFIFLGAIDAELCDKM